MPTDTLGFGTVLEMLERPVYLVESGIHTMSLMVATSYQRPIPQLVLTREILMPNATAATVSYTAIPGSTLEEWKRNMDATPLMIWKHLRGPKSGPDPK